MTGYIIRRTLQALLVIFIMSFLLYCLIGLMPGNPIDLLLEGNPSVTPEVMQQMRELYGDGQPLYLRYFRWLTAALQGDLGYSNLYFRPVLDLLGPALLQTVKLMILTLIVTIPLALILGILAARQPNGWIDNTVSLFAFASVSSPVFFVALVFIIVFAVKLRWLPPGGAPLGDAGLLEQARYLILPVLTLSLFLSGQLYLTLRGGKEQRLPAHATAFERNSMFGNQRAALDWMAAGRIPVGKMYTKVSPGAAQGVYQGLLRHPSSAFAVLFDWTSL